MDLLIRAGREDHKVIERLCAPATAGLWTPRALPLTGVVTDAHVAVERPSLRETAELAAIPFLIDPLTPLLTDEQVPGKGWAGLPYAHPEKVSAADLSHHALQDELIDQVIAFQREQGATVLIPPYLYADRRNSAWLDINHSLLKRTARYLERQRIDLPVAPIFAASLHQFAPQATWAAGLDPFLALADEMNTRYVAVSYSWSEQRKASYQAVAMLMTAVQHAVSGGRRRVLPWRQGLYGAALTGVGAAGYETGPGHAEAGHYPQLMARRRPTDKPKKGGGGEANVYFSAFGRSVDRKSSGAILSNRLLRAQLVCPENSCCPDGATSMTTDWREHAVRARHRELVDIERMPASASWRLNKIARDAEQAAGHARAANDVLQEKKISWQLPVDTYRHVGEVADDIRASLARRAA
ncbi:hypothetical protein SAMN05660748_2675 [Blastococcus aggregatus]|uniref:Uncharacterized protein n=1 Tax=Blastococcus aggregatus TaxID=38502 RepID=A0A285VBS0_9ACTN|nr:hypothetical protein [Blastococcus aggregatus]SOC49941.1 hypothetical protein SAMN05660748_2675 [Blastococcus aggregatus]